MILILGLARLTFMLDNQRVSPSFIAIYESFGLATTNLGYSLSRAWCKYGHIRDSHIRIHLEQLEELMNLGRIHQARQRDVSMFN